MTSALITMLTTATAIIAVIGAVIVTPFITLRVARIQTETSLAVARLGIAANVVSINRQRWIDDLRNLVAEFQTTIISLRRLSHLVASRQVSGECEWDRSLGFEKAVLLRSRLALLINPSEEDHKQLLILVDMALSIAQTPPEQDTLKIETELRSDIEQKTQNILKEEWQRVKAGD